MTHVTLEVGETYTFGGYSDTNPEPILTAGVEVRIISGPDENGGYVAQPVEGGDADSVFPEEIVDEHEGVTEGEGAGDGVAEVLPHTTAETVAEPVKAKGKGKGKAKATEADAAPAAETVKAKGKGKGKGKAKGGVSEAVTAASNAPVVEAEVLTPQAAPGVVQTFVDSASVTLLLSHQDALAAAKSLVDQVDNTYFTLGGVLHHIYAEGVFKVAGYDGKRGFADYVSKELGIQYRKAMYLIDIYVAFRNLGVDEVQLAAIGWSKAKELTKVATPDNIDQLMEMAATSTREEIQTFIQRETVGAGDATTGTRVSKTKLQFSLFEDQAATVTRALTAAGQALGNEDQNQALESICAEYLQTNESVETTLEDAIRFVEAKYGVTLELSLPGEEVTATASDDVQAAA